MRHFLFLLSQNKQRVKEKIQRAEAGLKLFRMNMSRNCKTLKNNKNSNCGGSAMFTSCAQLEA